MYIILSGPIASLPIPLPTYTKDGYMEWLTSLSSSEQMAVITTYQLHAATYDTSVPHDYLDLSLKAMQQLKVSGRSNVMNGLAKGLGISRDDKSDSEEVRQAS